MHCGTLKSWLFVWVGLLAAVPAWSAMPCLDDGATVRVTVHRFVDGPPSYTFVVRNNAKHPITSFYLGLEQGHRAVVRDNVSNVPTSIGSPTGWNGYHHRDQRGTGGMLYVWRVKDDDARAQILPGESLSGFAVQLPLPADGAHVDYEGRRVVQDDLTKTPFLAHSRYRTCYTGRVEVGE